MILSPAAGVPHGGSDDDGGGGGFKLLSDGG